MSRKRKDGGICVVSLALGALFWVPPSVYGLPFNAWSHPVMGVFIVPLTMSGSAVLVLMVRCLREPGDQVKRQSRQRGGAA